MTVRSFALGAALVAAGAAPVLAQGTPRSECLPGTSNSVVVPVTGQGGDACQKGVDLFNYLAPQLGTTIAGGNPVLGSGGTLGGLGKFSVAVRATVLQGGLPDVKKAGVTAGSVDNGQNRSSYDVNNRPFAMPGVDAAVGVFGGIPLGLTSVGGVDLLGSAFYLPKADVSRFSIDPTNGSLKVGYGARIGIIGESMLVPGVSFSWFKRDLPKTDIIVTPIEGTQDRIALRNMENKSTEWRLTAGKKLGPVGLAAGYGQDKYHSTAVLDYTVYTGCSVPTGCAPLQALNFDRETKATNLFANVQLNLVIFKLVGEVGQVKLKDASADQFYNQFQQAPDKARLYGSVGLKFGR